jgi:hypothetical protein
LLLHSINLQGTLFKQTKEKRGYDYVMSPVSGQAKLKKNLSLTPLRSRSTPRICCDLNLEEINISFTQLQYQSLIAWMKGLDYLERHRKYCKFRPNVPIKGNAKVWWEFAVNCHLEKSRKYRSQRNMDFVLRRCREMIVYVNIYRQHLTDPMSLTPNEKEAKAHIERLWTFEELKILRQHAMDDVSANEADSETVSLTPSTTNATKTTGFLQKVFPMWYGWYSSTPDNPAAVENPDDAASLESDINAKEEASQLEEELLDALEGTLDSVENETSYIKRTQFSWQRILI